MGIQNLFRVCEALSPAAFKLKFPAPTQSEKPADATAARAVPSVAAPDYDHIYYDVNNVIYSLLARTKNEEHFFVRLYRDIDITLKRVNMKNVKSVFLAVDGPGPRAKVTTQLNRRRKVRFEPDVALQRLAFTPGTVFMERLRGALDVYAATRVTTSRSSSLAVWVSGADCPGEGENKCFNHMRLVRPEHTCLIIGNDSDLIPYALQAHCKVHIFREQKGQLIDSARLKVDLAAGLLREDLDDKELAQGRQRIADDFVFLAIMVGNDYVPGATGYVFENVWSRYRDLKRIGKLSRNQFLFDATTKRVNWAMMCAVASVDESSTPSSSSAADSGADAEVRDTAAEAIYGRLHPKSIVNELLSLDQDVPIFEELDPARAAALAAEAQTPVRRNITGIRLTSEKGGWCAEAVGASMREALVNVAMAALAPGSELLTKKVAQLPELKLRKAAILLHNLKRHLPMLREWLSARRVHVSATAVIGNVPGAPPPEELPSIIHAPVSDADLYHAYLEGVIWSFEYYGGVVNNYGYCYTHRPSVSFQRLCRVAPQLSESWDAASAQTPPLSPLVLGLCLLPGPRRALLPPPWDKFDAESDPRIGHIFENESELMSTDLSQLNACLDEVERYVAQISSKMADSDSAKRLLQLNRPTAFMRRTNPLLKSFTWNELQRFNFNPPKMPVGTFGRLRDAPATDSVVAAVNLAAPSRRGWFHLRTPYMSKRTLHTAVHCHMIKGLMARLKK